MTISACFPAARLLRAMRTNDLVLLWIHTDGGHRRIQGHELFRTGLDARPRIYGSGDVWLKDPSALRFRRSPLRSQPVAQPGAKMAAGTEGDSNLQASHVGREQVLAALKAAFVQGRLAKDEFDLRVGQVLAAYAELDTVTADIPAGLPAARPPETIRKSHNKKLIRRGTAAGAGASVALTATIAVAAKGNPVASVVVVGMVGVFVAVLLTGLLTLVSWVLEGVASRQPSQGLPPGPSGMTTQRMVSADPAGSSSQISRDPPHMAQAARRRLSRLRLSSLKPPHRRTVAYRGNPEVVAPLTLAASGLPHLLDTYWRIEAFPVVAYRQSKPANGALRVVRYLALHS
jgi:hypothetical protein